VKPLAQHIHDSETVCAVECWTVREIGTLDPKGSITYQSRAVL
jgi:hypothetical protein